MFGNLFGVPARLANPAAPSRLPAVRFGDILGSSFASENAMVSSVPGSLATTDASEIWLFPTETDPARALLDFHQASARGRTAPAASGASAAPRASAARSAVGLVRRLGILILVT